VRRYGLCLQGWAVGGGDRDVFGEQSFDCVAAELGAAASAEQRVRAVTAAFGQPVLEDLDCLGGKRGAAFFAALGAP
jgi:hypothetical protein